MKQMRRLLILLIVFVVSLSSFNFVTVSAAQEVQIKAGDVDNNGEITATDALLALQFSVGKVTLSKTASAAARVQNSDTCTAADALLILQLSVGKISAASLPTGEYIIITIDDTENPDKPDKPDKPDTPDKPTEKPSEVFTALSADKYWSYSTLSSVQKEVYSKITEIVEEVAARII